LAGSYWSTDGFNLFKINRKSLLLEEIINLNLIGEEARILRPIQNSLIIATDRGNVKVFDLASKSVVRSMDLGSWDPIRINEMATSKDRIAIASEAGLAIINFNTEAFRLYNIGSGLPSNRVISLAFSEGFSRISVGLDGGGLVEIDSNENVHISDLDIVNHRINALVRKDEVDCFSTIGEGLFCNQNGLYEQIELANNEQRLENFLLNIGSISDSSLIVFSVNTIQVIEFNKAGKVKLTREFKDQDISAKDFQLYDASLVTISNQQIRSIGLFNHKERMIDYFELSIADIKLDGISLEQRELKNIETGNHRLRVKFISPSYALDAQMNYEYILDGFETTWNSAEGDNGAYYSNIGPGSFAFKVRVKGHPESEISFNIRIETPIWQKTGFIITVAVLGLLMLLVALWVRERYHNSLRTYLSYEIKKRTRQILQQRQELEQVHQEVLDSLTYAKRLQTAILPPDSHFDRLLPDSFVLYLPKDIVAGDFYWLEETADTILVAAADCTGHGVPGAMVSVVCNNALNRAVKEFSLGSPAGILGMTSILVDETFARSQEIVKDGMDISFCVIDFKNSKLRWAGAYNPIWIISKHVKPQLGSPTMQIDELMLYEIKGDKQPIGLVHNRKPFTEHEIDLDKEDVLYILLTVMLINLEALKARSSCINH